MREWGVKSVRQLAANAVCLFGLAFAAFSLLTGIRLGIAAVLVGAFLFLRIVDREKLLRIRRFVASHEVLALASVVLLALLFRMAFFLSGYSGDMSTFQCGDGRHFWNWAREVASGGLPEVKSWTTVAAYAGLMKLTGGGLKAAVALNVGIQVLTAWLFYVFGSRVFGRVSGFLAFTVYLLSPTFVMIAFMTISEHFFYLFVALSLFAVERCLSRCAPTWAGAAAGFAWLATWSRGEGAILVLIVGFCIATAWLGGIGNKKAMACSAAVCLVVVCLCGFAGLSFNRRMFGNNTFFCSNDSWWPRLHGANAESHGRMASKMPIYKMYIADHPEDRERILEVKKKPNFCPKELVPYIKEETARRWKEMSLWMKIKLIAEKEHYVWAHAYVGGGRFVVQGFRAIVYETVPVSVLLLSAIGLWRRRKSAAEMMWLEMAPMLMIGGVVSILALYESNIRYGMILLVLMPFYARRDE